MELFKRKQNSMKHSTKSYRNGQGFKKKKILKNARIGYAKEMDQRGDLVNVEWIKNGKSI